MTPEERFDAHEQWLLDHDRKLAEASAQQAAASARHDTEMAQIRATVADLAELTLRIARAVDRDRDTDGTR